MIKRKGIRKEITYTAILLVVSSLALMGASLSGLLFINQKNQLMTLQQEVVKRAVNEINWDIHEIETLLNFSMTGDDILSLNSDKQFDILSQILSSKDIKRHNILDGLILLNSNGRELARVARAAVYFTSDLGDRSNADEFIIPAKSGEIYYGPIVFDEITHEPRIMLSMPLINVRSETVDGILLGRIRLNRIWQNVADITFGKSGIVFITDLEGRVVAHPDPSVIYRNTFYKADTPEGIQDGLNDEKIMLASDRIQLGARAFTVYAVLPFREVIALSLQTLSATTVFLVVFMIFSIAISYVLIRRIVRPIETLSDTARNISAGNLGLTVKVGNADEIGDLSRAFNTMTSKLSETINSLKQQMVELRHAEEKINRQNEFLNVVLNSLTHPFYVIDANDYTIKMANPAAGFGRISGESTCYALTHQRSEPCEDAEHPCVIKEIKKTGKPATVEHIHYNMEGKPLINEVHGYPIFDGEGNIIQVIEYNLDITDRKMAEEKINASLNEKEVLLREIHHRVKNNMQIISSLLSLQSETLGNKKDVEMLIDSQNRIKSMALIHEKLYRSEDLARIEMSDYIKDLTRFMFQFHEIAVGNITLSIEARDIWFGIDTAIPCGLIINELVSNSVKHAFPENRKGSIKITILKTDKDEIVLNVSDDGIGIPEGIDIRKTKSLGLQLVTSLSEHQLRGKVELNRTKGTEFRISFKEIKYKKRI
jgi:two-component sensor histidine kinase/HAMP domain-containing protein